VVHFSSFCDRFKSRWRRLWLSGVARVHWRLVLVGIPKKGVNRNSSRDQWNEAWYMAVMTRAWLRAHLIANADANFSVAIKEMKSFMAESYPCGTLMSFLLSKVSYWWIHLAFAGIATYLKIICKRKDIWQLMDIECCFQSFSLPFCHFVIWLWWANEQHIRISKNH
jgi:hypothetical protein